jgi:hypothetical protein
MPPLDDASELTVACVGRDYLGSALARAVEDCDAHLINMNVTDGFTDDGRMLVHLRVNRRNAAAVARSLQRYGYEVVGGIDPADVADGRTDELRRRAAELLHILEI